MEKKIIRVLIHLACWLSFLALPFLLGVPLKEYRIVLGFFNAALSAVFFYLNADLFIPRFFTKGKVGIYILLVVASIVTFLIFNFLTHELTNYYYTRTIQPDQGVLMRRIGRPFLTSLMVLGLSTSYRFVLNYFKYERIKKEIENQTLVSELSFLKSQVSPHFLFNTLNNIYSLSMSNSEKTSEAVLKLSQLLRYMIYDSEGKRVSIAKEIEYLRNYIELQKLRLREDVRVDFEVPGIFMNKEIAPMLLIPFIENAFKHGVDYSQPSFIEIQISAYEERLFLSVKNSINKIKEKDHVPGIGLQNVKRRLMLLYPNSHELYIHENDKVFNVQLQINYPND